MASIENNNEYNYILASAYVDGELTDDEELIFQDIRKKDPQLEIFINSEKEIKKILAEKLPRQKAPDRLKQGIQNKLEQELLERDSITEPITESGEHDGKHQAIPHAYKGKKSPKDKKNSNSQKKTAIKKLFPYLAIAASLLLIVAIGYLSTNSNATKASSLESYTYKHFNEHAKLIYDSASISDIKNAEQHIRNTFNASMVVPKLSSAHFDGVEMIEFIDGFKTPVLVYSQPDINEHIYIFTFDLNKFPTSKLKRNELAIKNCTKQNDYYVENVNGKHVVSWKWDNIWYTAISNHDGNKLAALVEPLNQ